MKIFFLKKHWITTEYGFYFHKIQVNMHYYCPVVSKYTHILSVTYIVIKTVIWFMYVFTDHTCAVSMYMQYNDYSIIITDSNVGNVAISGPKRV